MNIAFYLRQLAAMGSLIYGQAYKSDITAEESLFYVINISIFFNRSNKVLKKAMINFK